MSDLDHFQQIEREGERAQQCGVNKTAFRVHYGKNIRYVTSRDLACIGKNKEMLTRDEVDILFTFAETLADVKTTPSCGDCAISKQPMSRERMKSCYQCKLSSPPFNEFVSHEEKDEALKALYGWLRVEWLIFVKGWVTDKPSLRFMSREIDCMHRTEILILTKGIDPLDIVRQREEALSWRGVNTNGTFVEHKKPRDRNEAPKQVTFDDLRADGA